MSHVEHQAICITSWDDKRLADCHKRIKAIGLQITDTTFEATNGYKSFFVTPCGSKAGWPEARSHLDNIACALDIINSFACEDGSNCIEFHVAVYGDHGGVSNMNKAPWPDHEGNDLFEGDTIVHPSGQSGKIIFKPEGKYASDQWFVKYHSEYSAARLCLQIGDKGRAVKKFKKWETVQDDRPHKHQEG